MGYTVKEVIALLPEGYTLIDYPKDKSLTMQTVLHLKCDKQHDWKTARLGNIKQGGRCFECAKENRGKRSRLDEKEFISRIEKMGYRLHSDFKGYAHKVTIQCLKCGHTRTSIPYNIYGRCKKCDYSLRKENAYKKLYQRLEELGYKLINEIDTDQKINNTRIYIECDKGHKYWVSIRGFVQKQGTCRVCQNLAKLDINQIRQRLDPGWTAEGIYKNEHSILTFTCPHGVSTMFAWNRYQQGQRCSCDKRNVAPLTPEQIHDRATKLQLKWVGGESEYVNTSSLLTFQCTRNPQHLPFKKKLSSMYANSVYCSECQHTGMSSAEIELKKYLMTLGFSVQHKSKELGFEVDLYLPEIKVGIEYAGLYYHNELNKDKNYHKNKFDKAEKEGVTLLTVFEDEYQTNPLKFNKFLKHILTQEKLIQIEAESCEIREMDKKDAFSFYADFHIFGVPERHILNLKHYGLCQDDHIFLVASFNPTDEAHTLLLERYAIDFSCSIKNGIEHLCEYILDTHLDILKIKYRFNKRYPLNMKPFNFSCVEEEEPGFSFVRGRERRTLHQLRIKNEDDIETIIEQRKKQGWLRIYDCGYDVLEIVKEKDAVTSTNIVPENQSNHQICWQYLLKQKYLNEDLIINNLTEEEIGKLSVSDFTFEFVPETTQEVTNFIIRYEWLGTMPMRPTHRFVARYKGILAGVVICSVPNTFSYILGTENKSLEKQISRGASISWAPKNLGSALIMFAIRWLVANTHFRAFTAYSDPDANEIGTIYQACNFYYLGKGFGTKRVYFDPLNPNAGWFSGRIFKKLNRVKQYAKSLGISWDISWNERWTVLWDKIPVEYKIPIKEAMDEHRLRCQVKEVELKHKYCYILGKDRRETKQLKKIFLEKNKIFEYPKRINPILP